MNIDKDLSDRLMEGRTPGDLFGRTGILFELTRALAERALSTEMRVHLDGERADEGDSAKWGPSPLWADSAISFGYTIRPMPALTRRRGIEDSIDATPRTFVNRPTRNRSNSASPVVATRSR